jgi:hypothetical protein
MKLRLLILLISVLLGLAVLAACEGPPPTQLLMEVTREVTVVVVVTATPGGEETPVVIEPPAEETTPPPGEETAETPVPTSTQDAFPTPVSNQIIVAEQLFERGRMFYLQPIGQIWVMIDGEDEVSAGIWRVRRDTWEEGMPEFDPTIIPPSDDLYQPIRGFGKLWREDEALRGALGWATETEYGHVAIYEYYAGGEVTAGEYVAGPGHHTLRSRYGDTFIFNEVNGTWRVEREEDD